MGYFHPSCVIIKIYESSKALENNSLHLFQKNENVMLSEGQSFTGHTLDFTVIKYIQTCS